MKFPYIIILIFLLPSCTQAKTKEGHPVQNTSETTDIGSPPANTTPVDDAVIVGGFKTNYRVSRAHRETVIYISIAKTECADLGGIEQFVGLEHLRLYLWETSDIDFSPLKSLPKLRKIYICGTALTELPDLGGIPSLIYLELSRNGLTNLNGIEKIQQLEWLNISEARMPVTDMSALRHLTKLRELYIMQGSYNIDFTALKDLAELDYIYLCDCGELDLSEARQLRQLKRLWLEIRVSRETGSQSVFRNIEEIGGMIRLKELTIDEVITSVDFLSNYINLEHLEIMAGRNRWDYGNPLLPLDVAPLGNLKKLKYLAIRGFDLKNTHVLDTLPELGGVDTDLYPSR